MKNRKIDFQKLISYGFKEENNNYEYHTVLIPNEYDMIIKFSKEGILSTRVIDLELNDDYYLINVKSAKGEHLERIRELYYSKLEDVINLCSDIEVFKSNQAKEIIIYIKEKYNHDPEFLWEKFAGNAVFRNSETKKWYAALLTISKRKLGLDSDDIIDIIDLRNSTNEIKKLVDNKKYFPGYHMNKEHWFTIPLDGSTQIEDIFKYIDISYKIK